MGCVACGKEPSAEMETFSQSSVRIFACLGMFLSLMLLTGCVTLGEKLNTKQGEYFSFTTYKAKAPAPTVLVVHGCGGPYQWSTDWSRRLVDWGYNAVEVDQFQKRGYPNGICEQTWRVPVDERNVDIAELVDWIKQQKWHKGDVGLVGASHGGGVAIDAAVNELTYPRLKATVALYPGCRLVRINYDNPKIPVQVHLGKQDSWTPCLSSSWKNYESYVYENAGHGFDVDLPRRQVVGYELWFDREAAELSQKRIREFLNRNLR